MNVISMNPNDNNTCSICDFYVDDDLLELSCNHVSHRDCFINNILTCKKCQEAEDDAIANNETAIFGNVELPMTPSDKMIPDPLRNPTMYLQHQYNEQGFQQPPIDPMEAANPLHPGNGTGLGIAGTEANATHSYISRQSYQSYASTSRQSVMTQQQLLSPRSSFNKNLNKNLFDSLMKPKVKFLCPEDKLKLNNNYELDYLVNIRPPKFFNTINFDKQLPLKNQIFDEIKYNILKNIINGNDGLIDFNHLGNLILFEIIDISTNGYNWDKIRLFLFEYGLVLIDLKGETLIGQILIKSDILSMTRFVSGIRLNLNNELIPELQICSDIPLIISRLEYYFKKLLDKQFVEETSLFQVTTNGWNLIKDNYSNLPVEVLNFQNCIDNNMEIPESLLIKSIPSPEVLPLNLIISIPLLNHNSGLSNDEYRFSIIQFLENLRSNLRSFDKLSLIFVGIDGSGRPCKKGSFIGSVEPNWSGWDSIYNEVKVQSNMNSKSKLILENGWEELSVALEKCKDLSPFLSCSTNNINKLILLSINNYEGSLVSTEKLTSLEQKFKCLLNSNEKRLSIDFFRIGDQFTPEFEFGKKICLKPSLAANDVLSVPYDCKLLRFNNITEFLQEFINILHNFYQNICLPNISIDILKIIGTRDLVNFFKIEVNGKFVEIEKFSNLKIVLNNITVDCEKNFLMKIKVDLTKFKINSGNLNDQDKLLDLPLLSFLSNWLNENDDYKVLNTKIYQDRPMNSFNLCMEGSLTPPSTGGTDFFPGPITPTSTSGRSIKGLNKRLLKKELDLEIIKVLKGLQGGQAIKNQILLTNLINFILNLKKDLIETDENPAAMSFKAINFNSYRNYNLPKYIDSIVNYIGYSIGLLEAHEPQALIACKDLTNWLV